MLLPTIFGESLFDDLMDFDFPGVPDIGDLDKKLYGKKASRIMKTDVHEHDDHFEADIDLPGFKKEQIKVQLEDGYLTVSATRTNESEEGKKFIRRERYVGNVSRSFYVGDLLTEEDIKAKFENGVLKLTLPKKEEVPKVEEKRHIAIEG